LRTPLKEKIFKVRRRFKESSILFQSDRQSAIEAAVRTVALQRATLESYIQRKPDFAKTLDPIDTEPSAPLIVKVMARVAKSVEVGPMAAVAGALADLALEAMLNSKATIAIVEDGGEVAASSQTEFDVGLYAGKTALSNQIGFRILPSDCPIGIATSSATVSHAISFGQAEAVTVFANTAALADGAATAICNAVAGEKEEISIQRGLDRAKQLKIEGTIILRGDYVGTYGRLPQLVKIKSKPDLSEITLLDRSSIRTLI
jgi:ApbE superfamily uncharacterized protein (UPF0280 family)